MLLGVFTTTSFGQNITPADSAVGVELFPTLTWTSTTAPYTLNVYSDSGLSTVVYTKSGITDTSQQISGLSNATDYWWTVIDAVPDTTTKTKFTTATTQTVHLLWPKSFPPNVSIIPSLKPQFSWYVDNWVSNLTYDIQVSTDSTFPTGPSTFIMTGLAGNSAISTTALSGGTVYFWRARSKTSGGLYSIWTSYAKFKTQTGLNPSPKPVPLWPAGNPTIFDSTPLLSWYLSQPAPFGSTITYTVEVTDTSGAYTTPEFAISGVTGLFTTVTTSLSAGTKYYWRVRSVNSASGDSTVSDEDSFTLSATFSNGAPIPTLSWPVGGATVYSNTPFLSWYLGSFVTGATFHYDVATDTSFGGTIVDSASGVTSLFTTVGTTLKADSTYYWRVKTTNGALTSLFSSIDSFKIASSLSRIPVPVLNWPVGGYEVFSAKPLLSWYLSNPVPFSDSLNFDIEIVLSSGSFSGSPTYSGVGSAALTYFYVTSALNVGSTYKWRVRTHNITVGGSPSAWSSEATFKVSTIVSSGANTPTPAYPKGNITISNLTPTLYWYVLGGAPSDATYEVELKPISIDFDSLGTFAGLTSPSYTTVVLSAGTQYHWRVRLVSVSLGTSAWSTSVVTGGAKFTTAATLAPPPPLVGDPIHGVNVGSSDPVLSWYLPTAPKSALKYRIQVSDDIFMNNIVVDIDNISSLSKEINSLPGGKTYYWRVQSKDANGTFSASSNQGVFSTDIVTAVDNETVIPKNYRVEQNFPNPFNPTTTIRYSLPEASFVTLKIYNILGQEVKTLVNEQKNAGTFNVQWRGDNESGNKVSSGAYIYRVIAGSHIFTKKMILLK